MRIKSRISLSVIHIVLLLSSIACIIPIALVLTASFTNENTILTKGYSLFPSAITLEAYRFVFKNPEQIINSYVVTIFVTVTGTLLSIMITAMVAYVICRKDFFLANKISFFIFFTLLFSGGLVPWYILISRILHLKDTPFALILPYVVTPFLVLLMKGFMSTIPFALIESAKMDGASEYRVFFSIIIPVSKSGLATIALFSVLIYWNDYWLSLLFIDTGKYVSLQLLLYRIMSNIDFLNSALAVANTSNIVLPSQSARFALAVVAAGPMLFIFPFFQRFFVKGITVGSIKG
ncbi:carbohydrate ABC transporter permease [Paenibacillus chondroitinus]|uniref:Carbohydrate ABC transporter permease n=1 Tax=Paenibacillus chondroitinus TaxID=59842 RepID=A0ABU6D9Q4_9BACL|nr:MULTISPECIES: carbohydrate ABC transporter permease [Paenibacillus]MCY9656820.1 carbohydrate ABC transporter permease [Paenibacillus anseongense]MEB4794470.1 carbohydrate ABC transporter permease [Paenibacillus chondroitinus]